MPPVRSPRLPGASAGALLLILLPTWAGAQAPGAFGPLTSEEGSPLQRITLTPVTESADPLERGEWRADLWLGYSNVFEVDSTSAYELYLDMERLISAATVRYGLADGLEIGGRLGLETTGGGVMDDFLTWWHGLLRVGNADRERYPSGVFGQRLEDGSGSVRFEVPSRVLSLEDVRLFAKLRVLGQTQGEEVLSVRVVTRIPVADGQVGDERVDHALVLLGRRSWTDWHLHGMISGSTVRASPELEDLLAGSAWLTSWALERRLFDSLSAVVQYSLGTPSFRGFESDKIARPLGNIVFGAAGRVGERWRWDVGFQEDIPAISPAVDFTLGLRVSRTW